MSIDNSAAPVKKLDPLNTLMGVRAVSVEPGDLAFAQAVGERFHDHRGKTVLGSIGVMIDGAMGGAVYSGLTSGHQSVLAQVTVSAGATSPTSRTSVPPEHSCISTTASDSHPGNFATRTAPFWQ